MLVVADGKKGQMKGQMKAGLKFSYGFGLFSCRVVSTVIFELKKNILLITRKIFDASKFTSRVH